MSQTQERGEKANKYFGKTQALGGGGNAKKHKCWRILHHYSVTKCKCKPKYYVLSPRIDAKFALRPTYLWCLFVKQPKDTT